MKWRREHHPGAHRGPLREQEWHELASLAVPHIKEPLSVDVGATGHSVQRRPRVRRELARQELRHEHLVRELPRAFVLAAIPCVAAPLVVPVNGISARREGLRELLVDREIEAESQAELAAHEAVSGEGATAMDDHHSRDLLALSALRQRQTPLHVEQATIEGERHFLGGAPRDDGRWRRSRARRRERAQARSRRLRGGRAAGEQERSQDRRETHGGYDRLAARSLGHRD